MSLRRILVLDCGISRVSAAVFGESKGELACELVVAAELPSTAIENWPAATAEAVERLRFADHRRLRTVVVLPSGTVILKQMRTPRVAPAKSRQVLEFAVGQAIPHAAGELVWDALSSGIYDNEVDHLVVAVKTLTLAPILRAIQNAGLKIEQILPSILAVRAAEPMCSPAGQSRRLLIETGAWGTTFLQTDGERFAVRALGWTQSHAPLATGAAAAVGSLDGIVQLAPEATRTLLHFNRQNHFEAPAQIILASEPRLDSEAKARLGEQLKARVECVAPTVSTPVGAEDVAANGTALPRLLGGAASGLGRSGPLVNLVPSEIREQEKSRRRKPWLVAATLLAASVLLPPIFHLRAESARRRQQSVELEKILAPLQAREKRMQALQTQLAALKRESERLQVLAGSRTSWLGFLAAVQDRLAIVEDSWLERLQTVAPEGDAPLKLVIHGCMLDRGAPAVAEKMRTLIRELRTIPGVGAVEGARFDSRRSSLFRFELVLVVDATHPL